MKQQCLFISAFGIFGIGSLLFLAGCGGGTASTAGGGNPVPTISPSSAVVGTAAGFTLTANGAKATRQAVCPCTRLLRVPALARLGP